MKNYELMNGQKPVVDQDGDAVKFRAAKDDTIIDWMYQKKGELNGFGKGPYWIRITPVQQ